MCYKASKRMSSETAFYYIDKNFKIDRTKTKYQIGIFDPETREMTNLMRVKGVDVSKCETFRSIRYITQKRRNQKCRHQN